MWFDCTKTALKKLKVAYNNSLRRILTSYLFYCMRMCILAFTLTIFKDLT